MSRLQEFKDALVPSYLYLWIYRGTNACGTAFYDCAHVANVVFFAAAAPFVYMIARQVAGKPVAAFLALLSIAAPINVYTAYFMPEAMYYFGFCVLSWLALTRTHWHWAAYGAATGLALGLLSLVKVHALFLVPALCLFLPYVRWAAGGRWVATGLGSLGVALACIVAVKFGLGYLLAGDVALSLFGNFYQGAVNVAGNQRFLRLIDPAFINGRGHLMALVLLLPLPLALIAQSVLRPPVREQAGKTALLQLYALLMLGAAAGVTVLYTASIAPLGVNHEGLRLHQRYYDFVFPLLWLVAAAALGKPARAARPALRWSIALLFIAVLAFALFKLPTYWLNPVDGPELYALSPDRLAGRILLGLDAAVLLLWAGRQRIAGPLFLFVALPLSVACGTLFTSGIVGTMRAETPPDRAASAALRYVPPAERAQLTVAGSNAQDLMRAQFRIDDKDTSMVVLDGNPVIEQSQIPVRQKWLLLLGKYQLPAGIKPVVETNEFSLVRVNLAHRRVAGASFARPFGEGLITAAEGLSHIEPWGRWSDAKQVVLHFSRPLPRHVRIVLKAQAYDLNTELPFTMHVGGHSEHFRLGWLPQEIGLVFDTDGKQRELAIDVPQPVQPSTRGQPDTRAIGIGLSDIEIGVIDQPDVAVK
jgi:phosphoglycerol transferase